jgi:hypothetical protein
LEADPAGGDTVVASICYLGTLPSVQRASVRAPITESRQLALATAEAVNGLRSKLPQWAGNAVPTGRDDGSKTVEAPPLEKPRRESAVNTFVLGTAVVWNLPDFPVAPGIVGRATLGVGPRFGIAIEAFVPTTGRELTSADVTATLRTSFVRVGPRFGWPLGDFELSGAALAGPSVTWATGEAEPPRVGTSDVTTGAVLSLAAVVEYPRTSSVFGCLSASASALLPAVEVDLGDGTDAPRGAFPLEASIGFGARWGGSR